VNKGLLVKGCVILGLAALAALGWRPEVPLQDGLARTLAFFKARRG